MGGGAHRAGRSQEPQARGRLPKHAPGDAERGTLLDELPNGVFLVEGEKSRLVLENQAAQMIWGVRWPVGMPMRDFFQTAAVRIFQADSRPLPCDELPNLRVFHQEEPVRGQQLMIRQATGATLPVLVSVVKLPRFAQPEPRCATGEASGPLASVVMQDISALREAERLKDEFVALVSHELKNPLTNIKGYVQLLRFQLEDGYHAPVTEQERLCLRVVEEGVDRLAALASDVIDVARLQSGRLALQLDDVELVGLVRRVVERQQMHAKAHVLQFQSAPDVLWLRADRQG